MKIKNKVSAKLLGTAVLSTALLFSNCKKEDNLTPIASSTSNGSIKDSLGEKAITMAEMPSDYYNIANALPKGYVKDGSKDYTSYVQNAINKYTKIAFPAFPILINDNGLKIPSNRYISFAEGAELRLKASSKSNYDIIRIENASNVTIYHANIVGDRYKHKGTSGEWGQGIGIYGSRDVNISQAKVINCWGDGIYVGRSAKGTSKDIRLFYPYCKSNRRDGISVTSVEGLQMIHPYAGYSDGTLPYCGINIEPNSYTDELKDIQISYPVTEKNDGQGIQIGFSKLYGKSNKYIDISVTNHTDIGSNVAFKTSCYQDRQSGSEFIAGTVSVSGANWQKNTKRPLVAKLIDSHLKLDIADPKVMNTSGSYLSISQCKSILEHWQSIWTPTKYDLTF